MMSNDREYDHCPSYLARPDELPPDQFPALYNFSAAFFYRFLPIPATPPLPPEYVYIPIRRRSAATEVAIAQWNLSWEAGPCRKKWMRFKFPGELRWIQKTSAEDLRLIPLVGASRQGAYTPLYHLLPLRTLRRFGLPALKRGTWPILIACHTLENVLPAADARLAEALAHHLWPLLSPGSPASAFEQREPIRILAHHLDFWLPYADMVAQERVRRLGRVAFDNEEQASLLVKARADSAPDFVPERPLYGGYVWMGEAEAWDVTRQMVESADRHGRLRAIIDAVRSHRVADDFSPRWSYAKEDFERKLYRKRAKVRVTFVELSDTIPVHGPDVEVDERLLWQDFLSLLNPRERRIVVCLRSGTTKASEIAALLGYANHSPVSKALRRIRLKAEQFLDN